ncbi:InlB B-repeat-containing protein [Holdemanella biformis]|uniref:InlB B-repeat-containing protein n=1 Tax=Holdemanella biformis TaxID=1735 RepID=UPI002E78173D|nr:InlB B-repeat-containing protein [Holdemanella biformis]
MLKNFKRASAILLSFAMAIQFGMADTYYANTVSQEPEVEEQTLQEPITVEQTTTQEVNAEQTVQPVVDAIEKSAPVSEKKDVTLSYVAEDGTILSAATTHTYEIDYNLKSDASVMLNFDGYTLKDVVMNDSQIVTAAQANLNVTSDLYSVKFVYQKVNTEEKQEENVAQAQTKTEETNEEDEAEANPEAKEELPEYPAFDESATAGNVTVHAIAVEGVLPRGAKLVVKRVTRKAILNAVKETVSEKDKEVDSAIALDVTIVSKDGIEIQPNGVVNISFENAAISGNEVNIYHVSDDASTVTEVATNAQSFDANHFSIYVITGENEVPLTTFNFVANGNIVSTQTVKTGDTLITPTAPDMDGKAFVGWYDGETKFEDFNTALTITETTTREITAKYEDALYVYFYNPAGTQIMRTEKVSDHEAHDFTNISYEVDATHKIVGWAAKKNGTANIADSITVPTDKTSINVYAIIKEGYWISFDSDGGSIVDSQFVLHGDKLVLGKDTTPTKPGYTFAGWYNGLSKVENGATVTTPMTLKAHWNAAQVSYTVIHWWENADDDGYSFHESENKTGMTGKDANAKTKSYDGFTAQPVTKKTIKGDGSTIVSVYYKRNIYKVEFFEWYGWKQYEDLTITAKYGQDISKQWPTKNGSSTWGTTRNGGPYQVNIATMPLGGAKFYGPKTGNGSETAYYYVEVLPGEPGDVTKDGIRYKLDHKDTSPGTGYSVTKEDQYPLTGYTFNENVSTRIRSKYNNAKFYYTRNSYKIKFINKGKEDKSVEKKYEQSISSENYTPVRPGSLPDYYEFDGWYDNELCEGEAFDFNGKKMPAQNVTLYAKWTAKKINLTYNLNNPEGDVVKGTKKVEAGIIANTVLPSATTTSDYSFAGWYYADGNGNITSDAYNTNEAITKDTSVIGKWLYNGELKVVYDPGTEGTNAKVPTDSNIYAGGAKVTVAKNATTTSKKKFLGWKLKGNLYHPGDAFEVNKDLANDKNVITLKAIWGSEEFSTTMSYNPGSGRGSVQTVPVKNNESVTLKSEKDFGYQAPETEGKEYYFAGWATSKDDANNGKATYAAGQSVHVDVDGENVLYATWIEKTVITLVANSNTVTYNGQSQEVNGFQSLTIDGYIVSGLNAHAQGTDVGTYPTEITGTAHVEIDNEDVTNKVVVKTTPGQLTITKKSIVPDDSNGIVVDGPKGSKYDGEKHENEPVVTDTKTGKTLVKGTDYTLTYSEDVINVGTVTVTITGTGNYEGTADTSYEITPRKVIMTSADGSKVYDGSALTKNKVTESEDGFVKDDGATYNVTGSQTDTGSSKNTFTYTLNEKTLEKNYVIETKEGTLEVTPVTDKVVVEIKGKTKTETYNGNTYEVEGYDVTKISDALYPEEAIHFEGTAKASRKDVGTSYMGLNVSQFSNTSANFTNVTFRVTDGWLKVTPKSIDPKDEKTGIQVTKPEDTMYNGKEQKNKPTVEDTKTGATLVENVDYTLSYTAAVNAGTVEVTITGIGNYTGTAKTSYEITKRNVTLTSANASKPYDKTPLTKKEVTVSGDGFVKEEGATYNVTGSQTEKGTSKNTFTYELKSNTKASNYTIEVVYGDLTVTAEDGEVVVIITGRKDTFEYTGTEKSVKGYDVSITEGSTYTESDFTFSGNDEVKGTEAGTYDMGLKPEDFTNNNENYGNVTFRVTDGQLTITPKSINPEDEKTGITATDPADSIYNGEAHVNPLTVRDTKTGKDLVENKDYTLTYVGDVVNVGTVKIEVKGIGNYTGEFTKRYKITPREYTVTTDSAEKTYDGTALTAGGKIEGIVDGEVVVVHTTGSQTDVGSTLNTYELEWKKASSKNYKLKEEVIGTLTVTEQTIDPGEDPKKPNPNYLGIEISNPSDEVYDGKEHKWSPTVVDREENALVEGTDYTVEYATSDFTNVGTIDVTITGIGNYTGTVTRAYKITPKAYTVTTESATKVYDGTALTAGGKVNGIISGETVEFTTTGSRIDEGTSKNTYSLKWNGSAIETNYKLEKASIGDLTVKAKSIIPDEPDTPEENKTGITVNEPSDSMYDGQEHKEVLIVKDAKTGKELVSGTEYAVAYTGDLVNAGTVTITVTGKGNYTGTFTKTYKITKRSITLTSATESKTYDGNPLTNTSITVSGDGFVKGEGATYEVTGSQTEVGDSANAFEYKLNENTLASNYDITKVVGTLTVTRDTIPVTPAPTPTTPSVPPVVQRVIPTPTPTPTPTETVEKDKTPKAEPKEEKVEKEKTPKAKAQKFWALINLICAIVTVLFGLLLLISKRHKDEDDEEEDDETKQQATTNEDEEQEKKRGLFTRVLAVLIAIVSVVFFLVTEDMSLAWTWTDQWTIWMVVIGLVQIVVFFVGRKWKNVDDDDEDEQAQQA